MFNQRKENCKASVALHLSECSFYHKAHLVKLPPLQIRQQMFCVKQAPTPQLLCSHACTHCHSCAPKWPKCLPPFLDHHSWFSQHSFTLLSQGIPEGCWITHKWGCNVVWAHTPFKRSLFVEENWLKFKISSSSAPFTLWSTGHSLILYYKPIKTKRRKINKPETLLNVSQLCRNTV